MNRRLRKALEDIKMQASEAGVKSAVLLAKPDHVMLELAGSSESKIADLVADLKWAYGGRLAHTPPAESRGGWRVDMVLH